MPGGRDDEGVRRLLLSAVPELRAPEDRLGRVAALVGRRQRQRWAAVTSAMAVLVLVAGAVFLVQRPTEPIPSGGPPRPTTSAVDSPSPSVPPSSPAPSATSASTSTAQPPGLAFLASLIPAGSAGTDQVRVSRTGAMPAPNGIGAFRQVCQYSHMAPAEPISAAAAPLMVFAGNTAAGASSTAASIATSGNSTCWGGTADRSAYWTNALIDVRSGAPVAPDEFSIRYSANSLSASQVQPMPAGLRLLSDQATWGCWDGSSTTYDRLHACPAGKQIVLNVWFPRCWNGTQLDSSDHRSHVIYPPGSRCPASHPIELPQLEYHVLYTAPTGGNLTAWRLSNDTSATGAPIVGYGGFFEGWQSAIAQTWIDGCIRKAATCESHVLGDGRIIEGLQ